MKKKILTTILLFVTTLVLAQEAKEGLKKLNFFIGKWDIKTIDIQPNGQFAEGKARSEVKYILDEHAMQDDFLMLDEEGNIVFRGTSIRSYNPRTSKFQIVWIMPGHKGITDIEGEWKDGKLVTTGEGYDGNGKFLERFEYYDITEDSYNFRMDRSYDGGKTWIEDFGRMEATRISD